MGESGGRGGAGGGLGGSGGGGGGGGGGGRGGGGLGLGGGGGGLTTSESSSPAFTSIAASRAASALTFACSSPKPLSTAASVSLRLAK